MKKAQNIGGIAAVLAVCIAVLMGCSGSSSSSNGGSPFTFSSMAGMTECFMCHQDFSNPSWFSTVFGDSAASQAAGKGWLNGRHANNERPDAFGNMIGFPAYSDAWFTPSCESCHDPIGEGTLIAQYYADTGDATLGGMDRPLVGCETCHGSGLDHYGVGPMEYPRPGPPICMACHELMDPAGNKVASSQHDAVGVDSVITDTHYDDPLTTNIEGYVINASGALSGACYDCHDPHSADVSINRAWANSAHGGYIVTTIDPVTGLANVTDVEGAAWVHYDFKANTGGWTGTGRQACQRCHTATGFQNLANDPLSYDADGNGLPDTLNVFTARGEQREMLYCWACHTDNRGSLRDPGAFSRVAPYATPATRIAAVPDLGGSNICMSCHSGRESGQGIKDAVYPDDIVGQNFGGFNSHYLPAGGILFKTIGYEFDGRDYSAALLHHLIGTDVAASLGLDTGENGPCVGCHMRGPDGHHFLPVTKDGSGNVTDITTFALTCSECHVSKQALVDRINTVDPGYDAAMDALQAELQAQGIYYGTGYPYFFADAGFSTTYTAWTDKDTLGAAFNLNMFRHMGGAYIHNPVYTRKLLWDSIDYLDGGGMDNSVEATVGGNADALNFLAGTRP